MKVRDVPDVGAFQSAAVAEGARVIVFDEPSSSLGESESQALYTLIRSLKARGVTLLYVSHRMPEIFSLCDAITVLRDGQHVITCPTSEIDEYGIPGFTGGRDTDVDHDDAGKRGDRFRNI